MTHPAEEASRFPVRLVAHVEASVLPFGCLRRAARGRIAGTGITRITAEEFPWKEPELVAVDRFRVEPDDLAGPTDLELRLDTPDGVPIVHLRATMTPEVLRTLADLPGGEVPLLNMVAQLDGTVFAQPGTYRIVTVVRGREVDEYPLVVVQAAEELGLVFADDDSPVPTEAPPDEATS